MSGTWIKALHSMPPFGLPVRCRLQHWKSKAIQEHELIAVDESDCSWRTAGDECEVSYDWTVIEWFESTNKTGFNDKQRRAVEQFRAALAGLAEQGLVVCGSNDELVVTLGAGMPELIKKNFGVHSAFVQRMAADECLHVKSRAYLGSGEA